jgi:hypothetical protein
LIGVGQINTCLFGGFGIFSPTAFIEKLFLELGILDKFIAVFNDFFLLSLRFLEKLQVELDFGVCNVGFDLMSTKLLMRQERANIFLLGRTNQGI